MGPTTTQPSIPITIVDVGREAEELVLEVLRSGRLAQGPMVERLEAAAAVMAGTAHAVAVSSGTTALVASLEVLDLEPGDEVLTSPFTFVATLNAILEAGAVATFADIDDDFLVARAGLERAITPETRVVMPVHLYGQMPDMARIADLASSRGLAIVEDAAQAHGASVDGRPAGSFGLGCFSLYATKNVAAGEGGLITTDDGVLADRLRVLRNQGMRERYVYEVAGHNYRMTDLQAAVGVAEITKLEERNAQRARNAEALIEGLAGIEGLVVPRVVPGRVHAWHQFTIRLTPGARIDRDELAKRLGDRGIGSGIYYPRVVFDAAPYRGHPQVRGDLAAVPNAAAAAREVLSLPVHWALSDEARSRIVDAVRSALGA